MSNGYYRCWLLLAAAFLTIGTVAVFARTDVTPTSRELLIEDFETLNPNAGKPVTPNSPNGLVAPFPGWRRSALSTEFESVSEHVTSGKRAARFAFTAPRKDKPSHAYPQALLCFDKPQDWSGFDMILVDVYEDRPLHVGVSFKIELGSADGRLVQQAVTIEPNKPLTARIFFERFNRSKGRVIDLKHIVKFMIYQAHLTDDGVIYFDNIRLAALPKLSGEKMVRGLTTALQFGPAPCPRKKGFILVSDKTQSGQGYSWSQGAEHVKWNLHTKNRSADPLAKGCAWGTDKTTFRIKAKPGDYRLWLASGNKMSDYDVKLNGVTAGRLSVTRAGSFCTRIFRVSANSGKIDISFLPRTAWSVSALALFPADDSRTQFTTVRELELDMRVGDRARRSLLKWNSDHAAKPPSGVTATERKRKFLVHKVDLPSVEAFDVTLAGSDRIVRNGGRSKARTIVALRGERASFVLHITALEDISALTAVFDVAADSPLPRKRIEMRAAYPYYMTDGMSIVPKPLTLRNKWPLSMRKGETWAVWCIFRCPRDMKSGEYPMTINLRAEGGGDVRITVKVKVPLLDWALAPNVYYGAYYWMPGALHLAAADRTAAQRLAAEIAARHIRNMVELGMNTIEFHTGNTFVKKDGKFLIRDLNALDRKIKWLQNNGISGPIVLYMEILFRNLAAAMGHKTHLRAGLPEGIEEEFYRNATAACVQLQAFAKQKNWPEILYYPLDEVTGSEYVSNFYKAVQKAGVRTFSTNVGNYGVGKLVEKGDAINIYCGGPMTPERAMKMRAIGSELWAYTPMPCANSDEVLMRFSAGLLAWKVGINGMIPWHYCSVKGSPDTNLDRIDYFFAHPSEDAATPTIFAETFHAGIVDRALLDQLAERLQKGSFKSQARRHAVKKAQAFLDKFRYEIPLFTTHTNAEIRDWMRARCPVIREQLLEMLIALN